MSTHLWLKGSTKRQLASMVAAWIAGHKEGIPVEILPMFCTFVVERQAQETGRSIEPSRKQFPFDGDIRVCRMLDDGTIEVTRYDDAPVDPETAAKVYAERQAWWAEWERLNKQRSRAERMATQSKRGGYRFTRGRNAANYLTAFKQRASKLLALATERLGLKPETPWNAACDYAQDAGEQALADLIRCAAQNL